MRPDIKRIVDTLEKNYYIDKPTSKIFIFDGDKVIGTGQYLTIRIGRLDFIQVSPSPNVSGRITDIDVKELLPQYEYNRFSIAVVHNGELILVRNVNLHKGMAHLSKEGIIRYGEIIYNAFSVETGPYNKEDENFVFLGIVKWDSLEIGSERSVSVQEIIQQ